MPKKHTRTALGSIFSVRYSLCFFVLLIFIFLIIDPTTAPP